jgi:protein ImuA
MLTLFSIARHSPGESALHRLPGEPVRTGLPSRAPALPPHLAALREKLRAPADGNAGTLAFGDTRVDSCFPQGGLPLGQLHEVGAGTGTADQAGTALEAETGALASAFIAGLVARLPSRLPILWIASRADLHPPGLLPYGLDPARLVLIRPPDNAGCLAALETALREGGAAAVVGEVGRFERTVSRRLQLACLSHGVTGFVLRRWPYGRREQDREATSVVTRWRLAAAPSERDGREPGPQRWRVALTHARGGRPGEWIMEASDDADAPHPFRVVAALAGDAAAPKHASQRASQRASLGRGSGIGRLRLVG